MFSSITIGSTLICTKMCRQNIDPNATITLSLGADIITGIALVVIGSLILSGVIPCNTIVGGVMIGLGCLQLILAPMLAYHNYNTIALINSI